MLAFIHHLPLIIGDLVPNNNKYWSLLVYLIKIIDLVMTNEIKESQLNILQELISAHNSLYIELFESTLKPKFHFLEHYPSAIRKCGPLKNLWCMRMEAFHKPNKMTAKATNSRVNIPYTVAIKACLKFSYSLANQNFFAQDFCFEERDFYICDKIISINGENLSNCYHKLTFRGKLYKKHNILSKSSADSLNLYEIENICIHKNNVFLVCFKWITKQFCEHL